CHRFYDFRSTWRSGIVIEVNGVIHLLGVSCWVFVRSDLTFNLAIFGMIQNSYIHRKYSFW
ncbi:MAG: hypothetical protein ABJH96_11550, partial [Algoriphagus sp.]|uniref:hypothetical protein n=1 Tax=Algoriphagus sp. TaxID=1872435 RepID=UPI00329807F8